MDPTARIVCILAIVACCVSSCGGDEFTTGSVSQGGNNMPAGGMMQPDGPAVNDSTTSGDCPNAEPSVGTECRAAGSTCSFGDSARPSCRRRYQCTGGRWISLSEGECPKDSTCPNDPPEGGSECVSVNLICSYDGDDRFCGCPPCAGFCASERWVCAEPPSGGCEDRLPNEGSGCDTDDRPCAYGSCALGDAVTASCVGGRISWKLNDCP